MERELELALFTAWQTARLSHYTDGKLYPLGDELKKLRPPKRQTSEEMLQAMRAIRATMGG